MDLKLEVAVLPVADVDRAKTVEDIGAARVELIGRGADVSEVWYGAGLNADKREPGPDPKHRSYRSWATFADPDGNTFLLQEMTDRLPGPASPSDLLQEMTDRLPGRASPSDDAALAGLLHETADHHGSFEAVAPPHHWWDWYAAYMDARQSGSTPDGAAAAAGRYMADVKHVVVDPSRLPATDGGNR